MTYRNALPAQPLKLGLLTYSSPKGQMLHQPSSNRAFFARCRAEGDVGNRTGVILGKIWQILR